MKDKNKKQDQRKKEEEKKKIKQLQDLQLIHRRRSLHDKHKERRKRDNMIFMPFIIAFQGDPSGKFYCNDIPDTFELIPRTKNYHGLYADKPLSRLKKYMAHHVVHIAKKVLIWKAA